MGYCSTVTRSINISAEIPVHSLQESAQSTVHTLKQSMGNESKFCILHLVHQPPYTYLLVAAIIARENVKQSSVCFASRHSAHQSAQSAFCCIELHRGLAPSRDGDADLGLDVTGNDLNVLLVKLFFYSEQKCNYEQERGHD